MFAVASGRSAAKVSLGHCSRLTPDSSLHILECCFPCLLALPAARPSQPLPPPPVPFLPVPALNLPHARSRLTGHSSNTTHTCTRFRPVTTLVYLMRLYLISGRMRGGNGRPPIWWQLVQTSVNLTILTLILLLRGEKIIHYLHNLYGNASGIS